MWWSRVVQNPRYCSSSFKIDGREQGHLSQVILTDFSSKTIKSYKKSITNHHPWKGNINKEFTNMFTNYRSWLITNSNGWIGYPSLPPPQNHLRPFDLEDQWHSPTSQVCSKDEEENGGWDPNTTTRPNFWALSNRSVLNFKSTERAIQIPKVLSHHLMCAMTSHFVWSWTP